MKSQNIKQLLFFILIALVIVNCGKDDEPIDENLQFFGDNSFKYYPENEVIHSDSELLVNGSLFIAGNSTSSRDHFLMKIDSNLLEVNTELLNTVHNSLFFPIDLLQTQDGNLLYLSTTRQSLSNNDLDIMVIKLNFFGGIMWKRSFGEDSLHEKAESITELPNGDFMILADEVIGNVADNKYGLYRISKDGELIFSKTVFTGLGVSKAKQISYMPSDSTVVVQTKEGSFASSSGPLKLTKFDLDGNEISSIVVTDGVRYFPLSYGFKVLSDGSFILYGSKENETQFGDYNISLIKFSSDLSIQWDITLDQLKSNIFSDLIETNTGDLYLVSSSDEIGNGKGDVLLTKLSPEGVMEWRKVYGSNSSETSRRILQKKNGNFLIVGSSYGRNGSNDDGELFILEVSQDGVPL